MLTDEQQKALQVGPYLPLSSSEVSQLLRDQNYDIGAGIVKDLSEYERDIRRERSGSGELGGLIGKILLIPMKKSYDRWAVLYCYS